MTKEKKPVEKSDKEPEKKVEPVKEKLPDTTFKLKDIFNSKKSKSDKG